MPYSHPLKKFPWKRSQAFLKLILILTISLTVLVGCSIGVKEKNRIIYVSLQAVPAETKGAIRIATNKKIPVTIQGSSDISTKLNIGGYFILSGADLKLLVKALAENELRKNRNR